MKRQSILLCFLACLLLTPQLWAQETDFVWIESETPSAKQGIAKLNTWGHEYFSGEWLHISVDADKVAAEIQGDGILLQYDFESKSGAFELWNRVGLEYIRSPFDWRIDDGAWHTAKPDDLTIDLMEVGFWCEIAWLKLGDVELKSGKHRLDIRIPKPLKPDGKPDRIIYASDCLCLYPGKFQPYSKYKPNEDHRTEKDREAAKYVFDFTTIESKTFGGNYSLAGTWDICRDDEYLPEPVAQPISRLPETTRWSAIEVPGDKNTLRPDLELAHRVWYRTKFELKNQYSGYIEFPQNNLNTTVYVNGQLCGFNKNPYVNFHIDISKALKPGVNEIYVGIRDAWYARTEKANDPMKLRRTFNIPKTYFNDGFQDLVYPVWAHPQSGILVAPTLCLIRGPVYVDDIFVKPSVENMELAIDVTLKNVSDEDQKVVLTNTCTDSARSPSHLFESKTVTVKANSEFVVEIKEKCGLISWTPGNPHLYSLNTRVGGDNFVTAYTSRFGFREWSISGKDILLNGVPYHGRADCFEQPTPEKWLQFYRDSNQSVMRFWGTKWQGLPPEEALRFFDENGIVCRRSGIFDGEAIGYNAIEGDPDLRALNKADDPAKEEIKMDLFRNWRDQMVAQVKAERNHPSVMLWSLENEILYINCINLYGGLMDAFEDEIIKTARAVKEVDPTRASMVDGGGATKLGNPDTSGGHGVTALPGLEIHGDHYVVSDFTKYPDLAYEPYPEGGGRGRWLWDQNRPRFIGEDFYVNGYLPADFAAIGGEEAFSGRTGARKAVGILYRMLTEGYRWNEYAAWQFWLGQDRAVDQYASNAPIAVLCKEWDWTFEAGEKVERTFKIFNDTQKNEKIRFDISWENSDVALNFGQTPRFAYLKQYVIPAGKSVEFTETLNMPTFEPKLKAVSEPGKVTMVLTVFVDDVDDQQKQTWKVVFQDRKEVTLMDYKTGLISMGSSPVPTVPTQAIDSYYGRFSLLVYDPNESVTGWLKKNDITFKPIDTLETIPQGEYGKTILLVGKDAITPANCDSTALQAFAAQGNRVIVLEQKQPLRYSALPCEMEPARNEGRIGFMENEAHPVFANLRQKDFFTWPDGHVLYRDAYKKPARGAKSLLQCDNRLENSAVVEVPVGQGVMILSQLLIGEKIDRSVVARQLLGNMINYAADYQLQYTPVVVCTDGLDKNFLRELDAINLKYETQDNPIKALRYRDIFNTRDFSAGGNATIRVIRKTVIIAATPQNLKALNDADLHKFYMEDFYQAGGTILLHGLTPEGLTEYNQLVGVDHMIREFRRERVGFPLRRSPLTQGLSLSDIAMSSGERIFGWASDEYVASDTYSYVVDLEDVAPFATYKNDFERMMSNGMVSADGWPYIVNQEVSAQPPFDFSLRFSRDIELSEVTWTGNTFYNPVTKFGLFFDGKTETAQLFDVEPNNEPQTFAIEPTLTGKNLSLRLADWIALPDKRGISGLDNIELKQQRPDDFAQKVQPLINIGAMVHYPKSGGAANDQSGIVLCNLQFPDNESVPMNAVKKRNILATILRNLGAEFVEAETIVAGTPMQYTPVNMAAQCNGYRSNRGWLDGGFTFEAMPHGLQKFAGVTFDVFDFPTSPVPNCVIMRDQNVEGIAVTQKADALYFLHTMRLDARRNRDEIRDGKLFETLKYVVRYDDGDTAEIPIYAEADIENYRQKDVTAIPGAMLGWVRRDDASTGDNPADYAVSYVKQWNNPHPDKTITAIDIVRGENPRGPAAVLAITAGKR